MPMVFVEIVPAFIHGGCQLWTKSEEVGMDGRVAFILMIWGETASASIRGHSSCAGSYELQLKKSSWTLTFRHAHVLRGNCACIYPWMHVHLLQFWTAGTKPLSISIFVLKQSNCKCCTWMLGLGSYQQDVRPSECDIPVCNIHGGLDMYCQL